MRKVNLLAAAMLSTSAMAMAAAPIAPTPNAAPYAIIDADGRATQTTVKRKVRRLVQDGRRIRSRGPQAKPKRKRNRITLGRRVRRQHRRAA